jgi:hypothetical protein
VLLELDLEYEVNDLLEMSVGNVIGVLVKESIE